MAVANVEAVKYIVIVHNMKRSIAFYRKAMGFVIRFESATWTELELGRAILALHGGGKREPRRTSLSFQVSDLNRACEAVTDAGGSVVQSPEDRKGEPIRMATVADTEGNEFILTQYMS